jgi:uncharacterized surface protein with fasciclin (FAS1) repeats
MKFIKTTLFKNLFVILTGALLLTSCEKDSTDTVIGDNLDVIINSRSDLSIAAAALKKTRLDVFTKGGGPFTVFAPTNAAFNAIGITDANALNALDSNYLVQLITYHIQALARTYPEIPLGPNATMSTQGGLTQYSSRYIGGSAYINGAQITSADIKASNGVLYTINKVLLPPVNTALVNLSLNPDYSLMYAAILKAGISATFTASPVTVFGISNAAMTAAGYDATTIAGLSGTPLTTLSNILKYHVIPQRIFSPDFKTGPLKTALVISSVTSSLNVTSSGGTLTVQGVNNPSAVAVIPSNILSTNGVIHGVNTLLKP